MSRTPWSPKAWMATTAPPALGARRWQTGGATRQSRPLRLLEDALRLGSITRFSNSHMVSDERRSLEPAYVGSGVEVEARDFVRSVYFGEV